jgi:hypothetical protein
MRKKLNTTLGFYSPTFIRMHVDTSRNLLDLNLLDDPEAESIYLHEYCHFIQDISTVYGLSNINMVVDYLKYANNSIIAMPPGEFEVPVTPVQNNTDNVFANLRVQGYYLGNGEDDGVTLTSHRKLQRQVNSGHRLISIPYIEVEYDTDDGRQDSFEFGALCIVESMAYIIETECYPNAPNSPDLPYRSAEKLVDLIYPEFGANRLNILALCDAVLSAFNPGPLFYDVLMQLRSERVIPNLPEDIYPFVDRFEIDYNGISILSQLITPVGADAVNQIGGYFNDISLNPVREWLRNVVSLGVRYRIANPTFPLDIARGGRIGQNAALADYMQNVGSPLVTNTLGEVTLADPRVAPITPNYATIWAISQIYGVITGNQRHCELVGFCCNSGIRTDTHCVTEPWRKTLQPNCAFGQMWRHWALTDYYPR